MDGFKNREGDVAPRLEVSAVGAPSSTMSGVVLTTSGAVIAVLGAAVLIGVDGFFAKDSQTPHDVPVVPVVSSIEAQGIEEEGDVYDLELHGIRYRCRVQVSAKLSDSEMREDLRELGMENFRGTIACLQDGK